MQRIAFLSLVSLIALLSSLPAEAGVQTTPMSSSHRWSTKQMFRDYLQTGAIYYGPHHRPSARVVPQAGRFSLGNIEKEAVVFAGLRRQAAKKPK